MINRFDQHVPLRSTFVPKLFTPNFDLYNQLLSEEQKTYSVASSLKDTPIDALQGADEQYAQQLRQELTGKVDDISNMYKTDLNAARRASRDLIRDTGRRTTPGGDIYELAARKKQFVDFQTEEQKRLQKGEINSDQYWASVQKAKAAYDQEGGYANKANLGLTARQQQVNFDKFANEFLDNLKADGTVHSSMYVDPSTGNLLFDKTKVTQLEAAKVQQTLSQAYKNAASATGQLYDMYDYRSSTGQIQTEDNRPKIAADLQSIETLNLDDKAQAKKAQQLLNQYGFGLAEDGVFGEQSLNALRQIEQQASLSDEDFQNQQVNSYIDQYTQQLANPYAVAKSYKELDREVKSLGRTLDADFNLARRKKELENTELRFDGLGISFDMGKLPTTQRELTEQGKTIDYSIKALEAQKAKATSEAEVEFIDDKIKYQRMLKQQVTDRQTRAIEASLSAYDPKTQEAIRVLNANREKWENQKETKVRYLEPSASGAPREEISGYPKREAIAAVLKEAGINYMDGKAAEQLLSALDKKSSTWLAANQSAQIALSNIALNKQEQTAVSQILDGNSFVFFDNTGVLDGINSSNMFTKDGILSDRMKVESISKTGFGEFGNVLTIVDKESGKTYLASPRNSNISRSIGENIIKTSAEGSDQYKTGAIMASPALSAIASQVNTIRTGETKAIPMSNNNPLMVKKIEEPSGIIYEVKIPSGFSDAGQKVRLASDVDLTLYINQLDQNGGN
jgi:hypothetical protein